MSKANVYNTVVDEWVRTSGYTRAALSRQINISASTLLKARAQEPRRGRIHWTTLALIACRMGLIEYGERIEEHDPRIQALMMEASLIGNRGKGAPNFWK